MSSSKSEISSVGVPSRSGPDEKPFYDELPPQALELVMYGFLIKHMTFQSLADLCNTKWPKHYVPAIQVEKEFIACEKAFDPSTKDTTAFDTVYRYYSSKTTYDKEAAKFDDDLKIYIHPRSERILSEETLGRLALDIILFAYIDDPTHSGFIDFIVRTKYRQAYGMDRLEMEFRGLDAWQIGNHKDHMGVENPGRFKFNPAVHVQPEPRTCEAYLRLIELKALTEWPVEELRNEERRKLADFLYEMDELNRDVGMVRSDYESIYGAKKRNASTGWRVPSGKEREELEEYMTPTNMSVNTF
ncbi:MAG: hypothetical protein Q9218_002569 [Villophora microphyllina]